MADLISELRELAKHDIIPPISGVRHRVCTAAADRLALLERVAEAAREWATECREDLGHDKMNLTRLVQALSALDTTNFAGKQRLTKIP